MKSYEGLSNTFEPNWQGLVDNILRAGTPDRVFHMELFHDREIRDAIAERFELMKGVRPADPHYALKKMIAVNRFCGWDYVVSGLVVAGFEHHRAAVADTADLKRAGGRVYQDEHTGPIMSWEDFERYPWPDADAADAAELEWYCRHVPEEMCIVGGLTGHFAEELTWLMGYETLCYALYDQRDLVQAIAEKLREHYLACVKRLLAFDRVKMIWASDDMGFKTGLMISPNDTRQFILTGHKMLAEMSHAAGRPYLLHACGNLKDIIDDLVDDVKIDAKHSFEDTIEDVRQVKQTYGRRIAMIGGIDVDFLCRSDEQSIR
ncbi:MAG TPA: uroporphyrinogen decarboxylase family protein, partial [Phycisphaerae bacterium]|nr:uroporphyrinogen decarboxylase family protein [Phycisphaerae bacterium]